MEQFRQIGEVVGSLKALMVFQDDIKINRRQCLLLIDAFHLAFDAVAAEMKQNLRFDERQIKWKALEHPMRELLRIFREGEQYIRLCMDTRDWWAKAIIFNNNTDVVEFHLHNLLWCVPVVFEAVEAAAEISGCDQEEIQSQRKRMLFSKKYEKEWLDPKLFQLRFGKQYLLSQDMFTRLDAACKEDRWFLLDMVSEKRSLATKQELRLAELLAGPKGKLFPTSILVGSKDYQVRRRLGNGSHYKEIQWMGESFAARHFFGDIEPLVPEIQRLSELAHPNIMNFMCAFSDEERKECFLLMELMNRDLNNHIKESIGPRRKVPFPLPVAVDIMLQIARGMEYLHSQKIYHGNLNPSNVLVRSRIGNSDGYLHVKIASFGLSSLKSFKNSSNQTATNQCIWSAPEVLVEQEQGESCDAKFTEKSDVYAFAMICFELLTGKVPFEDGHLQGDKMSRNVRAGERPLFPFPSPKYLTNLTKRCWQTDPSHRPSFAAICRILRYIKRFLLLNPEHSQPDPPSPSVDYFELETSLCKRFTTWGNVESVQNITQVPFQMFAYRVLERGKTSLNYKDRSSESGSEGASVCGDDNGAVLMDDPLPSPSRSPPRPCAECSKKMAAKKLANGKASKQTAQQLKGRALRPPQLTPSGRSMRINSESQLPPPEMSPRDWRQRSGHVSDSELG